MTRNSISLRLVLVVILLFWSSGVLSTYSGDVVSGNHIDPTEHLQPKSTVYNIFSIFDRMDLGDDYPYDIDTIKNMTLEDLNWTEEDIDKNPDGIARSYITIPDLDTGVNKNITMIEGTFGGDKMLGGDNYTMIPRDELMAGRITLKTIHAKHGAVLVLPQNYSNVSTKGRGFGFFMNTHGIPSGSNTTDMFKLLIAQVVSKFDTPALLAGEHSDNWESFDYSNQDGILYPSILATLLRNEYSADAMKMSYMYLLVRTNLLAHTLFERLLEQEGNILKGQTLKKGFFSQGGSKQGYARWLVGILDDRVTVLQADAVHVQNLSHASEFYYKDWGVPPIRNSSAGEWANFSNQIASILISLGEAIKTGASIPSSPWVLSRDIWDIYPQRHMLKPRFISITGDIGGGEYKKKDDYSLLHDGTYFVLGQESRFLRDLSENIEWRYGRVQTRHALGYESEVPYSENRQIQNALSAVEYTLNSTPSLWPKVENVSYTLARKNSTENYFNVTAHLRYPKDGTIISVWYAGNSDRRWNDPEHTGMPYEPDNYRYEVYKWKGVRMQSTDGITFSTSLNISSSLMYGYYVESETPGEQMYLFIGQSKMFHASPVEFIQEYPWEATGASDLYLSNLTFSNPSPPVGETVWMNATMNATRHNIWYEDENRSTGEKVGHYPSPTLTNIETALYINDVFEKTDTSTIVYSTGISFQWKVTKSGNINISVRADYNDLLPERNETNNNLELTINAILPDIRVSELGMLPSANITDGDNVTFTAVVSSSNLTSLQTITTALLIDNVTVSSKLIETNNNDVAVTFSWIATKGTHTVHIYMDTLNSVLESDELNNNASLSFNVSAKPVPDIWVSFTVFPLTPTEGDTVYINATVESTNLSESRQISAALIIDNKTYETRNISVNNSASFTWVAVAGEHTLAVMVDANNDIVELNETNNFKSINLTVISRPVHFPSSDYTTQLAILAGMGGIIVTLLLITAFLKKKRKPVNQKHAEQNARKPEK